MTPVGVIVVDKPSGVTSHDVVARTRKALQTRKVGHGGTLDPMATGVLLIGVDRATRLLGFLAKQDKVYQATIRLGSSTITDDSQGETLTTVGADRIAAVDEAAIRAGIAKLTGDISQVPSAISAIKVDGRRAHALVRAGESVKLSARAVNVERFDVDRFAFDSSWIDIDVEVTCSTGTYIRALARDLGSGLGVGGHLTALRRTRVGPFTGAEAIEIDNVGVDSVVAMGEVARRAFQTWVVDEVAADAVAHGRRIEWVPTGTGPIAITTAAGDLLALAERKDGVTRYLAVFV
ncbi:MAG: tRNA pseudouridine(55) synthase TruB [Actinobacteria bacterium]|nr:MAG: tRNA pseudouridine(55) synthase TruB [Actinomycetota bacterium]